MASGEGRPFYSAECLPPCSYTSYPTSLGGEGSSTRPDGDRPVWRMFWKIDVPQKVKICAWKLLRNGLPTRQVKKHRHLEVIEQCQRCGYETEDSFHAVVSCPMARAVWDAMGEVWKIDQPCQLQGLQ